MVPCGSYVVVMFRMPIAAATMIRTETLRFLRGSAQFQWRRDAEDVQRDAQKHCGSCVFPCGSDAASTKKVPAEIISKLGKRLACLFPNLLIILEPMWPQIRQREQAMQDEWGEGNAGRREGKDK